MVWNEHRASKARDKLPSTLTLTLTRKAHPSPPLALQGGACTLRRLVPTLHTARTADHLLFQQVCTTLSRAFFPEEEANDLGRASGAGRRTCDATLQSIAEADERATGGIADDEGMGLEVGANAGAVGSPGARTREGMLHLYE